MHLIPSQVAPSYCEDTKATGPMDPGPGGWEVDPGLLFEKMNLELVCLLRFPLY